ncbi:MAG: DNA adenine methylase [Acidobacteria bacterium]|nr:DNA adenine methylase [Acidobacteriota bacterium]MBI3655329.1 DNA adenine methylase [Acidobacteriota bacterium]
MQYTLIPEISRRCIEPLRGQLLKWVGNKQRFAPEIINHFPSQFGTYFEPFLGSGAILATLVPTRAVGSDIFQPLMEIWQTLHQDPDVLKEWYTQRCHTMMKGDKLAEYERIKASYNTNPNGADLLFLCRACYGGVVRFRQADGYMSTPCGIHMPIAPKSFTRRVDEWYRRTKGTQFLTLDFQEAMTMAKPGDLIYCDPPYLHSQGILYGAQTFDLKRLFKTIEWCKSQQVYVVLSIDGTKRSGDFLCEIPIPGGLFEREVLVNCGRSMLKRFQMGGQTMKSEVVADRLLLTY